jgi:hypothetical protein
MRLCSVVSFAIACFALDALHAADLRPGGVVKLQFPELPPTLQAMVKEGNIPATLTARLPDNYTPEGQWPLFVFLPGGGGGHGLGIDEAAQTIGPRDFIAVTMPLFKRRFLRDEPTGGLHITIDDFEKIRTCYRAMLGRLLAEVPGIVKERSTLGGFSNGAHTTATLLAGRDEFIAEHFRQFCFVDGGQDFLAAHCLHQLAARKWRLLVLKGDQPLMRDPLNDGNPTDLRPLLDATWKVSDTVARHFKLDWQLITMPGRGHAFPPEYRRLVGQWARGEDLDFLPPKATAAKDR